MTDEQLVEHKVNFEAYALIMTILKKTKFSQQDFASAERAIMLMQLSLDHCESEINNLKIT